MYLLPEQHSFVTIYCTTCGKTHTIMQVCRFRYCPHCGVVRRWRARERLLQVLKAYKRVPGYRLKMLTLAMQNSSNLEQGINDLVASFRRMRQSKFWKSHVLGGLFVIEITGSPGNWHPHIHAFIYSTRIDWKSLLNIWSRSSKGGRSVWIANISNTNAVYYVTKYITKTSVPAPLADELNTALIGKRLFQRFGAFQKINLGPFITAKICDSCGENEWITDFDIRRFKKVHPMGFKLARAG